MRVWIRETVCGAGVEVTWGVLVPVSSADAVSGMSDTSRTPANTLRNCTGTGYAMPLHVGAWENRAVSFASVMPEVVLKQEAKPAAPWNTIVWDDPVNLMSYVTLVFMTYFNVSRERAESLMLQVHNDGRAIVTSGSRESMERDVRALHEYGLWATMEQAE